MKHTKRRMLYAFFIFAAVKFALFLILASIFGAAAIYAFIVSELEVYIILMLIAAFIAYLVAGYILEEK